MKIIFGAVLLSTCVLLSMAEPRAQYPRPRRPDRIDNAEQISGYLKELQDYYSVHGRGRFGKRQMHIQDASVIFREMPFFEPNSDDIWKNLEKK